MGLARRSTTIHSHTSLTNRRPNATTIFGHPLREESSPRRIFDLESRVESLRCLALDVRRSESTTRPKTRDFSHVAKFVLDTLRCASRLNTKMPLADAATRNSSGIGR